MEKHNAKGNRYVYFFGNGRADGDGKMKDLLGGKGAGLAEMTNLGIPVPPGFTISTDACREYNTSGRKLPRKIHEECLAGLKRLERACGRRLGDEKDPLLVSVRSGAKFSMPGMMDTILNLGLNDRTALGLIGQTKDERFVWDSSRRFIAMYSDVVLKIEKKKFEEKLAEMKRKFGRAQDVELTAEEMKDVVKEFKALVVRETGKEFPQDPLQQLCLARDAVFDSWNNDRAIFYRKQYGIPDDIGTGVNIQAMVFGNKGYTSATGVGFTRNPATGANEFYGEYLVNAQGEDVVAGIRTPRPIRHLKEDMPKAFKKLREVTLRLERHFRDIQDFEFTIEQGKLFLLQTRTGKRTGLAAVKVAVDMAKKRLINKEEALMRVDGEQLAQYLFPVFDPSKESSAAVLGKGLPAGPGAATGLIALTPEKAVEMARNGERAILVRTETSPDDIHGMSAAAGILTGKGGMTSHAAVVARQMGKVCVAGCGTLEINEVSRLARFGGRTLPEGSPISLNGFVGCVYEGEVAVVPSEVIQVIQNQLSSRDSERFRYFSTLLKWADEVRRLRIRANADIPDQAEIAKGFGAEGIGLCRTEHMFFAEDRIPIMQRMILARTKEDRVQALHQLLPLQRNDFIGLFQIMRGYPVTIRLLDPPLHEFLPKREELMVELARMEIRGNGADMEAKRRLLNRVEELHEFNPMLGFRGCRLGILYPEITEMQARAIFEAACTVAKQNVKVVPEIMVPLVGLDQEMKAQKLLIHRVAEEVMKKENLRLKYSVGTMIELPRAAVTADQIAREAEFFSFGTNDLTQTTFGFSRDDSGRFIAHYLNSANICVQCGSNQLDRAAAVCKVCRQPVEVPGRNILEHDPFSSLDQLGVGALVKLGVAKGRSARPELKTGVCGEHGGDPRSIHFFHDAGLDYVSCSPYRVPIARLAAAQAAITAKRTQAGPVRSPAGVTNGNRMKTARRLNGKGTARARR
ncbi:MAG: pyruvate, phosphate dikinase [Nitrospirae bacterium]|nr:pyruvate, phosphate dikinase [Nitrospirota bacterium]